jgi:hypothetical protein
MNEGSLAIRFPFFICKIFYLCIYMLKGSLILFIIGGAYWLILRLYGIYVMFTENAEYAKENIKDVTLEMIFLIVPISFIMVGIALIQKSNER